ncbi:MFS family permease [Nonomuraea endophytica]|uniref:MFS family permease n=1 Tax=Nonomuraea endophytica TaxID=714136 RepID=A0A7W7ZZR3_9ACTN|nr:MFS family permease [Nonomuraea endophytica]
MANAVTQAGTQVTFVALPLAAVLTLDAGSFQLGLLTAAQMIAFLLVGLPAGVWVDRLRRRPILVWTDLIRGFALLSVPVAAWLGVLSLVQLYLVALVIGFCTVFFDVAHMSFLPAVVGKDGLERGNSVLEATSRVSMLAGPGLGGLLVQWLTAPFALLADAVSYLASGVLLSRVRVRETPAPKQPGRRLRREMAEGIRYVVAEPVLRVVALLGALVQLGNGIWAVGQPLYLIKELGVGAGLYGLMLSVAAVGGLAGAAFSTRITARFGVGRTMAGAAGMVTVLYLPMTLVAGGWWLVLFPVFNLLAGAAGVVFNITQVSYRQRTTPEHLLGRVNASMRFLMWSAVPIGGLLGGALGEWGGGRVVFVTGVLLVAVANLPAVLARSIRRLDLAPTP